MTPQSADEQAARRRRRPEPHRAMLLRFTTERLQKGRINPRTACWLCELVASDTDKTDADVKEVVLTALQHKLKIRHLRR